jgi:hypothetical protein
MRDLIRVLAVLFCGLALVPSGAHALALINKMALAPSDYMIAQSIYRGWALVGALVIFALIFTGWFSLMVRGESPAFWFALLAFLCVAATQFVFWIFTYPMNVLTENWSHLPENFETARRQWEYSHAVSAALNLAALICIIIAATRPATAI